MIKLGRERDTIYELSRKIDRDNGREIEIEQRKIDRWIATRRERERERVCVQIGKIHFRVKQLLQTQQYIFSKSELYRQEDLPVEYFSNVFKGNILRGFYFLLNIKREKKSKEIVVTSKTRYQKKVRKNLGKSFMLSTSISHPFPLTDSFTD